MATYFGHNANGSDAQGLSGYCWWNDGVNLIYTCPDTGTQDLTELGLRVYSGSTGNIRVAIYDTSLDFIAQGSAKIDVQPIVSGGSAWVTHTAFTNAAGSSISPQLQGGTSYILVCTAEGTLLALCDYVTSGYMARSASGGWVDGFPSSLTYAGDSVVQWCIRAGVDPAAATSQFARPSSDVADGNWLNEADSGTNLYASIDEVTASDTDYIKSGASPANDTCTVGLGALSTPVSGTTTMRIRAKFL